MYEIKLICVWMNVYVYPRVSQSIKKQTVSQ